MPELEAFLSNAAKLRLAVQVTTPGELGRQLKQVGKAEYDEQAVMDLYQRLIDLVLEIHGVDGLHEFMTAMQ